MMTGPFVPSPVIDPEFLGKVGALMDGCSTEREISLMSGNGVLVVSRVRGVNAHPLNPGL